MPILTYKFWIAPLSPSKGKFIVTRVIIHNLRNDV